MVSGVDISREKRGLRRLGECQKTYKSTSLHTTEESAKALLRLFAETNRAQRSVYYRRELRSVSNMSVALADDVLLSAESSIRCSTLVADHLS